MTNPLLQSYQKYTYYIRKFRLLGGVLHDSVVPARVSCTIAFIGAFLSITMSCPALNFVRSHRNNLAAFTGSLSFWISLMATFVKITCFALHRSQLIELEDTIRELFQEELAENSKTKTVVLSLLYKFDSAAYPYFFFVGGTLSSYVLAPLISVLRQHLNHVEPIKYGLPFPGDFPYSFEGGGFIYAIHFLFETSVTWFLYFTTSGGDTSFGYFIFHISSLLRSLTYKLQNSESDENPRVLLLSCVRKHRKLLRCRNLLQDIYGPIILYLVITNAVIMCILIFQGSQIQEMSVGKATLTGFYFFMKLTQTFMVSWYGGVVITESEKFQNGLFSCNWLAEHGKELKAELIITMLQRPMAVSASGFFDVSEDTFRKVMHTTLSYFFLLQTLDESD